MPDAEHMTADTIAQGSRIRPGGRGGTLVDFDPERGREAARRRWANVSKAARLGLADAGDQLPNVKAHSPIKVIRYLVEKHAMHAADPSARGSQASFAAVVKLAYPQPDSRPGDTAPAPASGDVAEMVAMWRAAKAADPALAERAAALLAAADGGT